MNDRAVSVLSEYDFEVIRTWKGRGAILFETPEGIRILKEYTGLTDKLALQNELLSHVREAGDVIVEEIIPNKEGELWTQDQNQDTYIVKTYFEGRECNIRDDAECRQAAETLAKLHQVMHLPGGAQTGRAQNAMRMDREYEKHNKELKKVRRFLRDKSQKNDFEIYLLKYYDRFMEQAFSVTEAWRACREESDAKTLENDAWCHGDYQYHNLLLNGNDMCVINFEKCMCDSQIRDLYLFLRKLLEKNNWSASFGDMLLAAYQKKRTLSQEEFKQLYYRLAYPEKFWKIVNFYYNAGKAWIPGRNMEKFDKLLRQEEEKQSFLRLLRQDI
ncbi:MAG: CotS family spore coat protein [Lachnospiraceae bacterium]|nr:CotS family spore coat protein [Lachnospiraceae bacterium]